MSAKVRCESTEDAGDSESPSPHPFSRLHKNTDAAFLLRGPILLGYLVDSSRDGLLADSVPAADLVAMVEEGRPAPSALLDERPDPSGGACVTRAGQELGDQPRPPVL